MRLYDPRAQAPPRKTAAAARLKELGGVRIALLDNGKWNAGRLLAAIGALLREHYPLCDTVQIKKASFARPAADEVYEEIRRGFGAAVTAVGD